MLCTVHSVALALGSKEAVIKSSFPCECDSQLCDSLRGDHRCIRVETPLRCMDRHTVRVVVLGLRLALRCMDRHTVRGVVLGLRLALHCTQRCTGSGFEGGCYKK